MSRASNVYQLLGLACRAGAVAHGTEAVRDAIRSGDARLVVLAGDAAPTQLDKVRRTLAGRPVPQASLGDRAGLGAAVGQGPIAALAVTSAPLAGRVLAELALAGSSHDVVEAAVEVGQG